MVPETGSSWLEYHALWQMYNPALVHSRGHQGHQPLQLK
jgi:hypothetical protein